MISKPDEKKGGDFFHEGGGYFYDRQEREAIAKTTIERQKPHAINLSELNDGERVPKNYHPKRGRCLETFTDYYEKDEDPFDIE